MKAVKRKKKDFQSSIERENSHHKTVKNYRETILCTYAADLNYNDNYWSR